MDSSSTPTASSSCLLEFPICSSEGKMNIPRRIRRRLIECKKSPSPSLEEIEAKLKEASLRRQQFQQWLSNKARRKPTSSSSSSQQQQHQHRLEAKLHAAHQKRLDTIAKAQSRLAKLDQLRQAAKSQVETRVQSRQQELGTKVESRVRKAHLNRMLLLSAHAQRKAAANHRIAQSILNRMAQDTIYKDCVTARIYQKRAAAETKRLRLLEAEKTRVQAKVLQVQAIANTVYHQREIERRRIKNRLEDRLQKARRQRAEFLKQRCSPNTVRVKMHRQGDILSRMLARCWRQFLRSRKTTFTLAKDYQALEINEKTVKLLQFEQFAHRIESAGTLQIVKSLLDRLENRLTLSRNAIDSSCRSTLNNIDHLLKRLASPKRRSTPRDTARSRGSRKVGSSKGVQDPSKLSRYPVRVVLCAYMIVGHPAAVFNGEGEHEVLLAEAAANLIQEYELLIKIIIDGPTKNTHLESASMRPSGRTFRSQLETFDAAWCSYLYRFVVWKVKDARSLEEDLVKAACQMELSMMQTCKLSAEGEINLTHDMRAVQNQVTEDQKLLREKVLHLTGDAGVQRMERALSDIQSGYFEAKKNGSLMVLPFVHISSPGLPSSSISPVSVRTSAETSFSVQGGERQNRVVRSLFKNDASSQPEGFNILGANSSEVLMSSSGANLFVDNEFFVNEIIHEHPGSFMDSLDVSDEGRNVIKANIKETMEKAFWDGITESLKWDEPEFGRIVELVKEVRDELCEMAPRSWKQNIFDSIDLDILSQVLVSGTHDLGYLRKILEFALDTLQKLSAPASEDELMETHKKLMIELGVISQAGEEANTSFVVAMIKGLRFVLEQTQVLKREISKARIRILEPVVKGPAGFEYLRKAFSTRYGGPLSAPNSLPVTVQWLLSVQSILEQSWDEHTDSLSGLSMHYASSTHGVPQTSLRTGGSLSVASKRGPLAFASPISLITAGNQPECTGNGIDKLVRLGLLKLISGTEGITEETIPETLKLNLSRLRNSQAQLQIIIVICISILVLRQTLVSEKLETTAAGIEKVVCSCVDRLSELLDSMKDVGITDIVEAVCQSFDEDNGSKKEFMANMLGKSLGSGDPVFEKVSSAVHLAARGVAFGGSGPQGKKLVETALRRVGAVVLSEKLIKAVEVLIVVATVTQNVHGPWYFEIINKP